MTIYVNPNDPISWIDLNVKKPNPDSIYKVKGFCGDLPTIGSAYWDGEKFDYYHMQNVIENADIRVTHWAKFFFKKLRESTNGESKQD